MVYAPIDIVFCVMIIILAVRACLHGFIDEVLNWACLVFGLLFAILCYDRGAVFLREKFTALRGIKYLPGILSFVILFLIVFIVIKILSAILTDIVTRINLGGLDRLLGLLFGVAEGLLLSIFVIFIIDIQPAFDKNIALEKSIFARLFGPHIETIEKMIDQNNATTILPDQPPAGK
jgi:membrane protein required for colicin V production